MTPEFIEEVLKERWRIGVRAVVAKHYPMVERAKIQSIVENDPDFIKAACQLAQLQLLWVKRIQQNQS